MINQKILFIIIVISLSFSLVTYSSAQSSSIPSWIKNIAGFWANDQITDQDFLAALQYLIDHEMLSVSTTSPTSIDSMMAKPSQDIDTLTQDTSEKLFSETDLTTFKVLQLQQLVANPVIIQAIINSNAEFDAMDDPYLYVVETDAEWKNYPKDKTSPFMYLLIENKAANILKTKLVIETEEFGDVLFPELIVTNAFGANVAITHRTDDYNQGDEVWWIKTKKTDVHFRDTMWDESAKTYSADIVIRIVDENGHFIGVLNAANPVKQN